MNKFDVICVIYEVRIQSPVPFSRRGIKDVTVQLQICVSFQPISCSYTLCHLRVFVEWWHVSRFMQKPYYSGTRMPCLCHLSLRLHQHVFLMSFLCQVARHVGKAPPSPPSRLNCSSSLGLCSYVRCSSLLTMAGLPPAHPCWSCTGSPTLATALLMSHQCWAVGNPLGQLAVLLPVVAFASRAHGWLMLSMAPTRTPRSLLPDCFPAAGVVPPQDLVFPHVKPHSSPLPTCPAKPLSPLTSLT